MKKLILILVTMLASIMGTTLHAQLIANAGPDTTLCGGGSVALGSTNTASGGTGPYTYHWAPATGLSSTTAANPVASPYNTTTYRVTVTDALNNSVSDAVLVRVDYMYPQIYNGTLPCPGQTSGTICAYPYNPVGPVTYSWNTGATSSCIAVNAGTTYTVTLTDSLGCKSSAAGGLSFWGALQAHIENNCAYDTICVATTYEHWGGNTGTEPYTYHWNTSATTSCLNGVPPGNYVVTVTDAVGCTVTVSANTLNPATLTIDSVITSGLSCNVHTCAYAHGGVGEYYYQWSPYGDTTRCLRTTTSGVYNVTVFDGFGNGCSASATVNVTAPPQLHIDSVVTTSTTCGNSNAIATGYASGGIPPYNYRWSNGANTQQITNVLAGNYRLTVIDAGGCSVTASVTIGNIGGPVIDSFTTTAATCYLANNGSACPNVSGGTLPYSYLWSDGSMLQCINNVLGGQGYRLTVSDNNGCTATAPVTIPSPPQLTTDSIEIVPAYCGSVIDGQICINVIGGVPAYSYHWSNGSTNTGCINSLPAGTYVLTVTDANNCTVSFSNTVPAAGGLQVSLSSTNVACFGGTNGSACANVTGGSGQYVYLWGPSNQTTQCISNISAGTYVVTVTDHVTCSATASATISQPAALGVTTWVATSAGGAFPDTIIYAVSGGVAPFNCVWDSMGHQIPCTQLFIVNQPGLYSVTITDANGCTAMGTATATSGNCTLIVDSIHTVSSTCGNNNGTACVMVSGGTTPYAYNWSAGGLTTQCITNVSGGPYVVTVSDMQGCTATAMGIVPSAPTLHYSATETPPTCSGNSDGSACVNPVGGTLPYTYLWSNNATTQCITGLSSGVYSFTVTDALNCTVSSFLTAITPPLTVSISGNDSLIYGQTETLTATATGGTGTVTYVWNTTNVSPNQTADCTVGVLYSITATDANNCTATNAFGITCVNDSVWPGDADYSGLADNNDLLPIGLAYGMTGPVRANASLNWVGQPAGNWSGSIPGVINPKHTDCDGNGIINADDTLAIIQNFGLTHARGTGASQWRAGEPVLAVALVPDTVYAGDTMLALISLGDAAIQATNVYALAFTVNYDPLIVDTTKTLATFGDSWLGTASDKISIGKDFKQLGQIKCAITRIDHAMRSGGGQIGTVSFIVTTDNINGKDYSFYKEKVWISDVKMIDNNGVELFANAGTDSSQVGYFPTGIHEVGSIDNTVSVYPNPANGQFGVYSLQYAISAIKITDVLGKLVYSNASINTNNVIVNTSNLSQGVYTAEIKTTKGTRLKRIVISR